MWKYALCGRRSCENYEVHNNMAMHLVRVLLAWIRRSRWQQHNHGVLHADHAGSSRTSLRRVL